MRLQPGDPGRIGTEPQVREPKMNDLLDRLRVANVTRCDRSFHPVTAWSPLEWAGAMCGEAGEAANLAKKIQRGDFDPSTVLTIKGVTQTASEHLADEVADMVIYADLLLARVGAEMGGPAGGISGPRVDLAAAIVRKFNAVSEQRGSDRRLTR